VTDRPELKRITLYDSSYTTDNLGDQIIMNAVHDHLRDVFPFGFFTGIPSHDYPGIHGMEKASQCDHAFVGGTNVIASHWLRYHQIKLSLRNVRRVKPVILMGVGWHKYQQDPDFVTNAIHRRLFDRRYLHSVRDTYTCDKLKRSGIGNVSYTGCPTMWRLTPQHMSGVPTTKSDAVLFALTAYLRNDRADRAILELLVRRYRKVHFWPQMFDDLDYLLHIAEDYLNDGAIDLVEPSLDGVVRLLDRGGLDYVGLRLHCGVLALQHKVRSLVVAVDNRASEIARDTGLPVATRDDIAEIERWINGSGPVELNLPFDAIAQWKAQFA
jgi:polysaccharide pyruvyl transferase WcaK-like protein